jgi:6-phosphogluconolactonase (cycloisomerase 2 family)
VAGNSPASIDVSPDGQWLVALDSLLQNITLYAINTSTGALTFQQSLPYVPATGTVAASQVRFAPSGKWIVAAVGTAGDVVVPFNTSSGIMSAAYSVIATGSNTVGDFAVAMDANDYLYVARSGLIAVYALDSSPTTQVSSVAAGAGPKSIVLNTGYNYVYAGYQAASTITGASIGSNGALTLLNSGTGYAAPSTVNSLARDNSGKYIVAAGYGSTGVELYSIGSTGGLSVISSAATSSSPTYPSVVAATH